MENNQNTNNLIPTPMYATIKQCLLADGDNENDFIAEGSVIYTTDTNREKWHITEFYKLNGVNGAVLCHVPNSDLNAKIADKHLSLSELRNLFETGKIEVGGIEAGNVRLFNICLKSVSKCIDMINLESEKHEVENVLSETQEHLDLYHAKEQAEADALREEQEEEERIGKELHEEETLSRIIERSRKIRGEKELKEAIELAEGFTTEQLADTIAGIELAITDMEEGEDKDALVDYLNGLKVIAEEKGSEVYEKGGAIKKELNKKFNIGDVVWDKEHKSYGVVLDNFGDPINGDGGELRLDSDGVVGIFTYDKEWNRKGYKLIHKGEKGDEGDGDIQHLKDSANRILEIAKKGNGARPYEDYKNIYSRLLNGEFDNSNVDLFGKGGSVKDITENLWGIESRVLSKVKKGGEKLYKDKKAQEKYIELMDEEMSKADFKYPFKQKVYDELESANSHMLNTYLTLRGAYGKDKKLQTRNELRKKSRDQQKWNLDYRLFYKGGERNEKVYDALLKEAKKDKEWAIQKEKEVGRDWKDASQMSREMLHERLDSSVEELADDNYDYLYYRSHALGSYYGSDGFIDKPAKEKWEKLSGETISVDSVNNKSKKKSKQKSSVVEA